MVDVASLNEFHRRLRSCTKRGDTNGAVDLILDTFSLWFFEQRFATIDLACLNCCAEALHPSILLTILTSVPNGPQFPSRKRLYEHTRLALIELVGEEEAEDNLIGLC